MKKPTVIFLVMSFVILLATCKKNEEDTASRGEAVFDSAFLLEGKEIGRLERFLDSLNQLSKIDFVFSAIGNYELKQNTDSLAVAEFDRLKLQENSCLIFISENTRSFKILIGEVLTKRLSKADLDETSLNMIPLLKEGKHYEAVSSACIELVTKYENAALKE